MKEHDSIPMPVRTSTLLRRMFKAANPQRFLNENEQLFVTPSFTEYLDALCLERKAVREQIIHRAGIERSFGHQLFRGSRKPSRDNVLRLAFGFGIDVMKRKSSCARASALTMRIKGTPPSFGLSVIIR